VAVLKVIEVVGLSDEGWGAAACAALAEASRTIRHIEGLEVVQSTAVVHEGAIVEYRVLVKLTFRVEDTEEPLLAVEAAETLLGEPTAADREEPVALVEAERLLEELGDGEEPETRP
jgi:flavin-binding protein dodecin